MILTLSTKNSRTNFLFSIWVELWFFNYCQNIGFIFEGNPTDSFQLLHFKCGDVLGQRNAVRRLLMQGGEKLRLVHEAIQGVSPTLTDDLEVLCLLFVDLEDIHLGIDHGFFLNCHRLF